MRPSLALRRMRLTQRSPGLGDRVEHAEGEALRHRVAERRRLHGADRDGPLDMFGEEVQQQLRSRPAAEHLDVRQTELGDDGGRRLRHRLDGTANDSPPGRLEHRARPPPPARPPCRGERGSARRSRQRPAPGRLAPLRPAARRAADRPTSGGTPRPATTRRRCAAGGSPPAAPCSLEKRARRADSDVSGRASIRPTSNHVPAETNAEPSTAPPSTADAVS